MLLTLLIFNILSNAVTLLDNRIFYYSRNISIGIIYSILLCNINIINIDISIFNGLLHIDNLIQVFTIFILLSSLIILNLTNFYPYKNNNINKLFEIFSIVEYSIIILFINIGAILLISSLDIVTIFLSLELQSYGLYILCTLHRNSESSTSAGLKYFLLGSLASCLILLGLAFIYANIGNTNLENLQIISTISYDSNYYNIVSILNSIEISLIILSIGFLFKIAAAPKK
jgi:NADH-ubiquinone oxidoreductase chain 2